MPRPGSNSPVQLYRTASSTVYTMRASVSTGNIWDRRKQSKRWIGDSRAVDAGGVPCWQALQKENAGETGVYYWKKKEARNLFAESGVQFPGGAMQDGLIHSILKNDSPVNRKYLEQTETKQTLVWGKAWQWTRMGSRSAADNVGTFGWFSPDRRYGLKANSPRELIGLKESFPIIMGAAIPHGSHCDLLFLGTHSPLKI